MSRLLRIKIHQYLYRVGFGWKIAAGEGYFCYSGHMLPMQIITSPIHREALKALAKERFGDMVKSVVDIERNMMAIGGELHADEEQLLLEQGSKQENLWGINLYPDVETEDWLEFDSMINLRPSQGNRSRGVDNPEVQERIRSVITSLCV